MDPGAYEPDTIAAIATAAGIGGVGIIRLSGPQAFSISAALSGRTPQPRQATFAALVDSKGETLDQGLILHFPGPHSFTGEDVAELHCHGGPVLLRSVLRECLLAGARHAEPGEFSQRAFLNDKIDLVQAEAIADLISSSTDAAVRSAARSLSGAFSNAVSELFDNLVRLRVFVESAIDFPEEEIDFIAESDVLAQLKALSSELDSLLEKARRGRRLHDGIKLVIIGPPNAGKSSLLNQLAEQDAAIVTDIPGTTRDTLHEHIQIDGLPLHIVDTAGLRETTDAVEREGIRRAQKEVLSADHLLLLLDGSDGNAPKPAHFLADVEVPPGAAITVLYNKCDISGTEANFQPAHNGTPPNITMSARTGAGLDLLRDHLRGSAGLTATQDGSDFSARERHIRALEDCAQHLSQGALQLQDHGAAELVAEDLRLAQDALGRVTGRLSSDDLLGEIFSSFCIGK